MILLGNLRSGTEWFLKGLLDTPYGGVEMFSPYNANGVSWWSSVSTSAKLSLLNTRIDSVFYKIQFVNLETELNGPNGADLRSVIDKHKIYLLTRRDRLATLRSFIIAEINDANFHGDNSRLTKTVTLTQEKTAEYYEMMFGAEKRLKNQFEYVEQFVYEDLVSGAQVPQTLSWDPTKSPVVRRDSSQLTHLITNYDEFVNWVAEIEAAQ